MFSKSPFRLILTTLWELLNISRQVMPRWFLLGGEDWGSPGSTKRLLLALFSGVTNGGSWGTISDAGVQPEINDVQHKCLMHVLSLWLSRFFL